MINELFGWISVLASLAMGIYMGQKFRREDWLGGYGSFPRRMVRLAHVALSAIGILNIQFAQTLPHLHLNARLVQTASVSLMAGAVLMPACCLWMAWRGSRFEIFAAPVVCLATGMILTIGGLIR
jgi:glucose-6-phosphate-specific signal transduction histidine kinase